MTDRDLKKVEAASAERRRRYEVGEFDALMGRQLREAAGRGDPRALALEYDFWREVLATTKGGVY